LSCCLFFEPLTARGVNITETGGQHHRNIHHDEKTNKEIKINVESGTEEYYNIWKPFLQNFYQHLKQKGWDGITRIAMDERSPQEMQVALKLLKEIAPGLNVALADNHRNDKRFPDQIVDLCVAHGTVLEPKNLMDRNIKNYITTWYVCCADSFPNVFTFSPPAEAAFIGWYTIAAGFDGFLRWAFNSWVKEPLLDSRFRTWPAGDTYIVYPNARSSIRFERLVEGIQDAEKIRILREELQNDTSGEAKKKLVLLNETVTSFNITTKPDDLEELMARGKQVLTELSK